MYIGRIVRHGIDCLRIFNAVIGSILCVLLLFSVPGMMLWGVMYGLHLLPFFHFQFFTSIGLNLLYFTGFFGLTIGVALAIVVLHTRLHNRDIVHISALCPKTWREWVSVFIGFTAYIHIFHLLSDRLQTTIVGGTIFAVCVFVIIVGVVIGLVILANREEQEDDDIDDDKSNLAFNRFDPSDIFGMTCAITLAVVAFLLFSAVPVAVSWITIHLWAKTSLVTMDYGPDFWGNVLYFSGFTLLGCLVLALAEGIVIFSKRKEVDSLRALLPNTSAEYMMCILVLAVYMNLFVWFSEKLQATVLGATLIAFCFAGTSFVTSWLFEQLEGLDEDEGEEEEE
ncbi:hypothetical protein [Shouchella lonarensis]|uniref:Uncharacterized protein n=1 Tax=Shouchella lonarensis TaxID=1464122 RepID=A0A1G6HCG6_9BACI|nr:hypothetical protein [Shouchella lonarensis]SDB91972.1 hypothetical protein SAMN05421737_103185 [Shouchella lonarensis]